MGETTKPATGTVSESDAAYLRDLARKVAEIGNDPVQERKAEMWTRHNDLERVRPMVLAFPEGSWRELLPGDRFRIGDRFLRRIEGDFLRRIYYWEHMQDDNVTEPAVYAPVVTHTTGWGLRTQNTRPEEATGAYHIDPVIHDESDIDKLEIPRLTVDWDETERLHGILQDLFADILTVEKRGVQRGGAEPLDFYSQLRGIDNMYMDLIDKPEMVHKAIGRIIDGRIQMIRDAEEQGAMTLGNRNNYAGSGGTSYTKQLPQPDFDGTHVRARDLWGFATAQIFSEVSPAMHEEFALTHEARYCDLFGLNCYGCCEPLHHKLDALFRTIPRLRRISISPWADVDISAEKLADRYIYSWKPNPSMLAGERWQPDVVRREMREFCERTRGNVVEIIMKDTHTVRHEPRRMWEWVRITREVAEEFA